MILVMPKHAENRKMIMPKWLVQLMLPRENFGKCQRRLKTDISQMPKKAKMTYH